MALTRITEGVIKPNENYVVNNINSSGVTTSTNFKTGTSNLHNVGIEIAGINVLGADTPIGTGATIYDAGGAVFTGVVTATSFSGSGNVSGVDATFTGNVSIGGTLTYEDVTNIDSVGVVTARQGIKIPDDNKSILLGASDDMRIRHTGSHSEITDEGTGSLRLGGNQVVIGKPDFSETSAVFTQGAGATLKYADVARFETTSTGAVVTGILTATGNVNIAHGTGQAHYQITQTNGNTVKMGIVSGSDFEISGSSNNNIIFKRAGTTRLTVTSTGISVTGIPVATQSTGNVGLELHATGSGRGSQTKYHNDHGEAYVGTAGDTTGNLLVHNSSNSHMLFATNNTERFRITSGGQVHIGNTTNNAINNALFKAVADDGEAANLYVGQFINKEATAGQSFGVNIQAGSSSDDHGLRVKNRANDTFHFLVRGDGKVGIGEGSPDELLHIASTGTAKFRLTDNRTSISDGSQYGVIQFEQRDSNTPGVSVEMAAVMQDTTNGNTALQIKTGTPSTITERLRITGSGLVKLLGDGGNDGFYLSNAYGQAGIFGGMYYNGSSWVRAAAGTRKGAGMYVNTGGHIAFLTASETSGTSATAAEKLRITNTGSVNIGGDYTQTSKKFKVTGNSTIDGGLLVTGLLEGGSGFSVVSGNLTLPAYTYHDGDSDTYYGFSGADEFSVFTGGAQRLRVQSDGNMRWFPDGSNGVNLYATSGTSSIVLAANKNGSTGTSWHFKNQNSSGQARTWMEVSDAQCVAMPYAMGGTNILNLYNTTGRDGLNIFANVSSGNQNSDCGAITFNGYAQTNGAWIQGTNELAWGKKDLLLGTSYGTGNNYDTRDWDKPVQRLTYGGWIGMKEAATTNAAVKSLLHIKGTSVNGAADATLTIEDSDTTAGSKEPIIAFDGAGTRQARILSSDNTSTTNSVIGGLSFGVGSGNNTVLQCTGMRTVKVHNDVRGWATVEYNSIRQHTKMFYSPGNAVATHTILRIRRYWWGWGNYKIRCKAIYYNSSLESTYYVNGHGSGGNSYSISNETFGGSASSNSWNCTVTHTASNNSPGGGSPNVWYADIQVNIPNYYYVVVWVEAWGSSYSTDPTSMHYDSYCLM